MRVILSASELLLAAGVGMRRHASHVLRNTKDLHGAPESWDPDVEGACAELAAARALCAYWTASVDHRERHAGDILTREGPVEVRCGTRPESRLILHPEDPDDRRFVLVVGRAPAFDVVGWILARDGKRPEHWADPTGNNRPAFFTPRATLRPMAEWSAPVDPLRARVESDPAIRRLVAAVDGRVEGVEPSRLSGAPE